MEPEFDEIALAKTALRATMRTALARITPAVREEESISLCERLQPQLRSAGIILFFAPLASEPDIWPMLETALADGKTVALPWFDAATQTYRARCVADPVAEIVAGRFGVREPAESCLEIPPDAFHLVLVPGLAFDLAGNRLGRGKGYYDRLLKTVRGIKCGICHTLQLTHQIPAEPHDAKVDFILTPDRCVRARA
jgi:5-formyltetrahydrofolate cyclo-ligase